MTRTDKIWLAFVFAMACLAVYAGIEGNKQTAKNNGVRNYDVAGSGKVADVIFRDTTIDGCLLIMAISHTDIGDIYIPLHSSDCKKCFEIYD